MAMAKPARSMRSIPWLRLLVVLAFYRFRRAAQTLLERLLSPLSPKLAQRVGGLIGGLADGLSFLTQARSLGPFAAVTACYWICNAITLWVALEACGLAASLRHGFLVLGALSLGLMLPSGPGFFGSFQLAVFAALALFVPPSEIGARGAVAVFWIYSLQGPVVLLAMAVSALRLRRR